MRALVLTLFITSVLHAAPRVEVPRIATGAARTTPAPLIDGELQATEWHGAVRVELGAAAHALLLHDDTFLYIALTGPERGIGSICTQVSGDVRVLHASAALGTATFVPRKEAWPNSRAFAWTNRDTSANPEALLERRQTLQREGWFANTTQHGSTQREFQIRIRGEQEVPLALAFMSFESGEKVHVWPEALKDGCAEVDLASGKTDRAYTFAPAQWGVAVLR